MKGACLTLLVAVLVALAGSAFGQLRFPDATEQTTAFMGATSGGSGNTASGVDATVGGGYENMVTDDYGTVGGGSANQAGDSAGTTDDAAYATVGGGRENTASGAFATVPGGWWNTASGTSGSTVGGGYMNAAYDTYATVAGGRWNSSGYNATVGGGYENTASGAYATVPGGWSNTASGDCSFAAGYDAAASNNYSFVWGDSDGGGSAANNTFNVHASGGIYLNGALLHASDKNKKEAFQAISPQDILAKLAEMPLSSWRFKTESETVRHIGPTAQDFKAAFSLGNDDRYITTVDGDGVALAAIQGLYQVVQDKDIRIRALEKKLAAVETRLASLMDK